MLEAAVVNTRPGPQKIVATPLRKATKK